MRLIRAKVHNIQKAPDKTFVAILIVEDDSDVSVKGTNYPIAVPMKNKYEFKKGKELLLSFGNRQVIISDEEGTVYRILNDDGTQERIK